MKAKAPIALFVYNRALHTRKTIDALLKNSGVAYSDLVIYSDGPKNEFDADSVNQVRDYIRTVKGFKSLKIVERSINLGLAASLISGVTEMCEKHGRVIVLEDDLITSPHFLSYMNEALRLYESDQRVISVHAYTYPVEGELPEAFFLRGADCWGWATWKRGWDLFNPDGKFLLGELKKNKLVREFDFNGSYSYSKMLKDQIIGKNNSWAIRWYASAFIANKLTLYPGRSLVHNIGNDGSGTHCGFSTINDTVVSKDPINLELIQVEHSTFAYSVFENFLSNHDRTPMKKKLIRTIKKVLSFFHAKI